MAVAPGKKRGGRGRENGQSLIEVLIALTVGGVLVGTAATLMAVVLRVSSQNVFLRTAASSNEELMEKVTAYAGRRWHCEGAANCGIYNLQKGLSPTYFLISSGGAFVSQSGEESFVIDDVPYARSFSVQNVCRLGEVISGVTDTVNCASGVEDPSSQYVTVRTSWTYRGGTGESMLTKYLTRSGNTVLHETEWSIGSTTLADPVYLVPTGQFYSATNIDYRSAPGALKLTGP